MGQHPPPHTSHRLNKMTIYFVESPVHKQNGPLAVSSLAHPLCRMAAAFAPMNCRSRCPRSLRSGTVNKIAVVVQSAGGCVVRGFPSPVAPFLGGYAAGWERQVLPLPYDTTPSAEMSTPILPVRLAEMPAASLWHFLSGPVSAQEARPPWRIWPSRFSRCGSGYAAPAQCRRTAP